MNNIKEAAEAFFHLTRFQYDFTIGRKGVKQEFRLDFDKADFHHLCGLHKLRDIPILQQGMRTVIFDKILAGELDDSLIEKSVFYDQMAMRIQPLKQLEGFLDNNDIIFRYNEKAQKYSLIQADYLLEQELQENIVYLFLGERVKGGNQMCRTLFPKSEKDYTIGQPKYTLLEKKKVEIESGETTLSYIRGAS